ncbi:DUF4912 domain-containing protein [Aeoliella sp. SH292]|uniref:DUF4912 domain-containing protein n=1 Tax=Aeoliella sp. SH292 TaxID=3454464 RepID=UPI003F9633C0
MTAATLRTYTCKDLAQMAKKEGVAGWHSMRKEELIDALAKASKRRRRTGDPSETDSVASAAAASPLARLSPAQRHAKTRIDALRARISQMKNIASPAESESDKDRIVLMVRDAYWLQAFWEVRASSVERARTALGHNWHGAKPTLRIYRVLEDGSSTLYREIAIHGGVNHWYVDVSDPPNHFRAELGYSGSNDAFYCLCRSNKVSTPMPGSTDAVNGNWNDVAENADRIYAMSGGYSPQGTSMELQQLLEERLQRRMGRPTETRFGNGASSMVDNREELSFAIDAELVIYGATAPNAHVTVEGEPVTLRPDGTFAVRMHLPDRRQVVPVVASAPDGVEQKTIILGIERNTKELEPMHRDSMRSF